MAVAVFWVIVLIAVLIAVFYYRWESEQIDKDYERTRAEHDFGDADDEWFDSLRDEK